MPRLNFLIIFFSPLQLSVGRSIRESAAASYSIQMTLRFFFLRLLKTDGHTHTGQNTHSTDQSVSQVISLPREESHLRLYNTSASFFLLTKKRKKQVHVALELLSPSGCGSGGRTSSGVNNTHPSTPVSNSNETDMKITAKRLPSYIQGVDFHFFSYFSFSLQK